MKTQGKYFTAKRVIISEVIAFISIILFVWLDELIDIPDLILGAEHTPVNWRESLFESLFIAVLGFVIVKHTRRMFQHMKYLEGILPICASCKKIRDDTGQWQQIESYIHDESEAKFSHGICPECAKKLYPEFYKEKV